jgi:predicted DNA-binding transcriptional regulator AlpA
MALKKKPTLIASNDQKRKVSFGNSAASVAEDKFFDNWITKKLLAIQIGMSISFVNKYMKEGLPFRRRGRAVRFRVIEVEEWLQRRFIQ